MTPEQRLVLLMLLPVLTGLRDPFQPPEDKCRHAELSRWRYGGAVGHEPWLTGFIQDGAGKWQRVKVGQHLAHDRVVRGVTGKALEIELNARCEPSRWHGSVNEGARDEVRESTDGGDATDRRVNDDGKRVAHNADGG